MHGGASCDAAGNVAPYRSVMEDINVLLMENDPACLFETGKKLQMCAYKVTLADHASSAISMLSNGNTKTDVVMLSTNSPDGQGFHLLQLAVAMGIPVVLLSVDEDPFFTSKAIQDGAFLIIPKQVPMEFLKLLWQHIMREKMQKDRREINAAAATNNNVVVNAALTNHMGEIEPFRGGSVNNNVLPVDNNNVNGSQIDGGVNDVEYNYGDEIHWVFRRKSCTEWTDELHAKFVDAVLTLGDGRCFPKEIMLLMNVPGLTRMQVASHLQKCRNENWRMREERRNQLANQSGNPPLPIRTRRFGCMPNVCRPSLANNGISSSQHNPDVPAALVHQNVMGSAEPMNPDVVNNHDQNLVVPHSHQLQIPTVLPSDGPDGLVQNGGVGSAEPMNLDVVAPNNNNFFNYGSAVPHQAHNQQILPEINNSVVDYNYGAGTTDAEYLTNLADDFALPLTFGDNIDSFFNSDEFASLDLSGGLFNHVPGADNVTAGYDQQPANPFYGNQQNGYYNQAGSGNCAQ